MVLDHAPVVSANTRTSINQRAGRAKRGLQALFAPGAVAVVGASRDPTKLGSLILRNIRRSGFPGPVYPINPRARQIQGLPAYPRVTAVPGPVDLAVVVVPRDAVLPVIEDCAARGTLAAIIITAGFRESGPVGAAAEEALVQVARAAGMRILGPNCLGVIDTLTPLNASFAARMPMPNGIALVSQSGALGTAILDWSAARQLGFSKFVSLGNEADITESDLLDLWETDESVRVAAAYLEAIPDGGHFRTAACRFNRRRPLVVLKAGRTEAGARAATSHTGALAGSDAAYAAAFHQTGTLRVDTLEALFDAALAFSTQPLPEGRGLTIVTNAGGPAVVATDAASAEGLTLAPPGERTRQRLRSILPSSASITNPIDILGDADARRYRQVLEVVQADPATGAILTILTPQLKTEVEETAGVIAAARAEESRPIVASFMGGPGVRSGVDLLARSGIPNYPFPERAVGALAALARYADWRRRPPGEVRRFTVDRERVAAVLMEARRQGWSTLDAYHTAAVVAAYGIPVPRGDLARDAEEAARLASAIGFPVVLKVVSPDIIHKSEVGGVRTGLGTAEDVRRAFTEIKAAVSRKVPTARIEGIAVWAMAPPGIETIVGLALDPTFGHLLLFGLGGIHVEILRDVTYRLVPVTDLDAEEMTREIRAAPVLAGTRGQPPADRAAITAVIERVSQLAVDFPVIRELDLNPLIVYPEHHGAVAVDARLTLSV